MDQVPTDILSILLHLICYANVKNWLNCCLVCKYWKSILKLDKVFWKYALCNDISLFWNNGTHEPKFYQPNNSISNKAFHQLWSLTSNVDGLPKRLVTTRDAMNYKTFSMSFPTLGEFPIMQCIEYYYEEYNLYCENDHHKIEYHKNKYKNDDYKCNHTLYDLIDISLYKDDYKVNLRLLLDSHNISLKELENRIFGRIFCDTKSGPKSIGKIKAGLAYFVDTDNNRCMICTWHKESNGYIWWIYMLRLKRELNLLGIKAEVETARFKPWMVECTTISHQYGEAFEIDGTHSCWSLIRIQKATLLSEKRELLDKFCKKLRTESKKMKQYGPQFPWSEEMEEFTIIPSMNWRFVVLQTAIATDNTSEHQTELFDSRYKLWKVYLDLIGEEDDIDKMIKNIRDTQKKYRPKIMDYKGTGTTNLVRKIYRDTLQTIADKSWNWKESQLVEGLIREFENMNYSKYIDVKPHRKKRKS
jgi:hypothetical protein